MASYPKPPAIEVLCEVQFILKQPWKPTYTGQFYSKFAKEFPIIEPRKSFGVKVDPSGMSVETRPDETTQFFNENRDELIQFGPAVLSVNKLKPYYGWKTLRTRFFSALGKYLKVVEPIGVQRASLRYINRIDVKEYRNYAAVKQMLNLYPVIPAGINQEMYSINTLIEIPVKKDKEIISIGLLTLQPVDQMTAPIQVDISYQLFKEGLVKPEDLNEWFDAAHEKINHTFENLITEKCRQTFL